jgi:threonine/homoserine/homoserine lactone efflux protein
MSTQSTALFLGATLTMLLVPGPSALFAFTRSLERGPRAGLCAVAGLETGLAVHVLAAALGISGTVASSPVAFSALRVAGAGYLALVGVRELVESDRRDAAAEASPASRNGYARQFRDGMLVDLSNPKTLLFCLAFLPQFVDTGGGSAAVQAILLGVAVVMLAAVVDSGYALSAVVARRRPASPATARVLRRASGAAFLGLAALTCFG